MDIAPKTMELVNKFFPADKKDYVISLLFDERGNNLTEFPELN